MNKLDNAGARQVLDDLLRDIRRDSTNAEIDEMILGELEKGEGMNADLVQEALHAQMRQDVSEEVAAHHAANWAAIEQKLDRRGNTSPKKKHVRLMHMAAAALIALAVLSTGTVATYAFRWNFLIKIFQPVMDTLGIHMNVEDVGTSGKLEKMESSSPNELTEVESIVIHDEAKLPRMIRNLPTVPRWLPGGYVFQYAEVYDDYNETCETIVYCKGTDELFVQSIVYSQDVKTAVNILEKDAAASQNPDKLEVVENNGVTCASYVNNLAYYVVWGRLSRDDIVSVITSIEGAG